MPAAAPHKFVSSVLWPCCGARREGSEGENEAGDEGGDGGEDGCEREDECEMRVVMRLMTISAYIVCHFGPIGFECAP